MRTRHGWLFVLVMGFALGSGCAFDDVAVQGPRIVKEDEDYANQRWREGYGFNNPNVQRIRDDKEPKDFGPTRPTDNTDQQQFTLPGF